jgi:hypothetical protein
MIKVAKIAVKKNIWWRSIMKYRWSKLSKRGRTETTEIQPWRSTRIKYPVKKFNLLIHFACMSQVIRCNELTPLEKAVRDQKWKMTMD